ncbi:hypothetical protein H072_1160 [Dactylellina haptotyla CBS 200.50]|uniref:Glutamine amidotransferase type-2 domain-containing protein n=1 Tax=Dactylellina haptotyla (strain CBS 200.50) TaxID=1284197 RepID=S8AV95_DACHA|nr:hypothetical protein H072_1160 [Dactylellina haptotyla CBS 200.50]
MCGILFELSHAADSSSPSVSGALVDNVGRRGPDSLRTVEVTVSSSLRLKFTASVLSLRGTAVVPQPLSAPSSNRDDVTQHEAPEYVLCWNGEAWRFDGQEFPADENDTQLIFQKLSSCDGRVQDVLQLVEGPFAFVFYDGPRKRIWFGRDWLGRRSLLFKKLTAASSGIAICSISGTEETSQWDEVEADGFYFIDLEEIETDRSVDELQNHTLHKVAFVTQIEYKSMDCKSPCMKLPIPQLCKMVPSSELSSLTPDSPSVTRLYDLLHDSLRLRVQNIPLHSVPSVPGHTGSSRPSKVGVLFSGGVDCTMLARIAHDILPIDEPIELLNVAFENKRVIDAAIAEAKKSKKLKKAKSTEEAEPRPEDRSEDVASASKSDHNIYDICPDRQTGRKSWRELQRVCPNRDWRFQEINVPYEQVLKHKQTVIALLHPHDTEMDLSIGLAFYFASRPLEADSPRTLLSGLGADELFGGYARHGTAFNRAGYPSLIDELELDITRLGKRNLGRDDRIIANWGREARFPFLDERLLREVISWPVSDKCGFGAVGTDQDWDILDNEKKVLRLLAWKLGMKDVAGEKKRAIQFGARTAKMEATKGGKVKGTQKISLNASY